MCKVLKMWLESFAKLINESFNYLGWNSGFYKKIY